jgi:hypothetical protein
MRARRAIANFDSAAAMLRALARLLHGKDFPALGVARKARPLAPLLNALPEAARERIYIWSGFGEAISARKLEQVRSDEIARWVVGEYPRRRYRVAFVGSSNGAIVHLAAALGAPWLPQTFLVPVRHDGLEPDDPRAALE